MTINTTTRTAGPFIGAGTTTVFPFTFKVFSAADIVAVQTVSSTGASTTLTQGSAYSVSISANQNTSPGGSVMLSAALPVGNTLVLTSSIAILQPTDLTNNGGFYPSVITNALDRLTVICQQLFSASGRSLRVPLSDIAIPTELPNAIARANNLLGFDSSGNPVAIAPNAQSATALQSQLAASGAGLIGTENGKTLASNLIFDSVAELRANASIKVKTCGVSSYYGTIIVALEQPSFQGNYFVKTSDTTSADNGGSIIVDSVGNRWYLSLQGIVNICQFGADKNGIADATSSVNSALLAFLDVYAPKGTFTFSGTINLRDSSNLIGAGMGNSTLGGTEIGTYFIYNGIGTFINAVRATDNIRSPIFLSKISFNGVTNKGAGQIGLSMKYRHDYDINNCSFENFNVGTGITGCWLGSFNNLSFYGGGTQFLVNGDGNRVCIKSCSFVSFTSYGIRITNANGIDGFGTFSFQLINCDIEYAQTGAVCISVETDQLISLRDCYVGEGCSGPVFNITSGKVLVDGGLVSYGEVSGGVHPLVNFSGINPTTDERSLTISNAQISGGLYSQPSGGNMVANGGPLSKLYIKDSQMASIPYWNGGASLMSGDCLGYAPGMNALATSNGLGFLTGTTGTATKTATFQPSSNSQFLQATNSVSDGSAIYANQPLVLSKLLSSGAVSIIVVYKSNSTWSALLDSGVWNIPPTSGLANVLPSTGGLLSTAIVINQYPINANYTNFNLWKTNQVSGDYIEIHEVFVFDSRQAGNIGTVYAFKNLYKPI